MKFKIFAAIAFAIFLNSNAFALDPSRSLSQYILDSWQTKEGLPQNTVQAITQTKDGYLWFGTQEGLARFDGEQFTVFDKRNTPALASPYVLTLLEDDAGRLWIGTNGGLALYENGKFSRFTQPNAPDDVYIRNLYLDPRNRLWIGTDLGGLNLYQAGKFSAYTMKNGLSRNFIRAICLDHSGTLWAGTDGGGLNRMLNGAWEVEPAVTNSFIGAITEDSKGALWVGTLGGGLFVRQNDQWKSFTAADVLPNNFVRCLYQDRRGAMWIGTEGGLVRFYNGRWERITKANGLASPFIWSLWEDHEGSMWIGLFGGGLARLKDPKFLALTTKQGLADDHIWSIYGEQDGTMWFGTVNGGVTRWKDGVATNLSAPGVLPNNNVRSVWVARDHTVWIGTSGGGACALRNGKCAIYSSVNGLSNDFVRSILEDSRGNIWIGTNGGGLNLLRDGKFTVFNSQNGLSGDFIRALLEDHAGNLWIAIDGGGLVRYSNGTFTKYGVNQGLGSINVLALYEDADHVLWIGTLDGGLNRLQNGKIICYKIDQGMFDDGVFQIAEDSNGYLWMGSNKGIFRVLKKQLNDFAAGKIHKISSESFGISDGMISNECNGGAFPSVWKDSSGRMWFATDGGVVYFSPGHLPVNQQIPKVHVESIIPESGAKPHSGPFLSPPSFPPDVSKLEFHYTALSYLFPQKMKFKYKLEGFDHDWIQAQSRRVAYYTNLPPGTYTFRVIASNNDGLWNEKGDSVSFELMPRFYETYWFYGLCILILASMAAAIYRYRMRQMRLQFAAVLEERNRISREIHDTLTQDFTAIVLELEAAEMVLEDLSEDGKKLMGRARDLARNGLAESRRFVQALRPAPLDGGTLSQAMKVMAERTLSGTGIHVEMIVSGRERALPPGIEDNLLRITQEACTNIRKHSDAKHVRIHLHYKRLLTEMRIQDDGVGFDPENPTSGDGGFGLTSMRERAAQSKGRIEITSAPGKGTTILVTISKF